MKEFKFRAIIENDIFLANSAKKMGDKKISHTVLYFDFNDILTKELSFEYRELLIPYYLKGMIKIDQYTGLKDKNRKDIYEGDILVFEDWKPEKVIWLEKTASYGLNNTILYLSENATNKMEIIGNIYENPYILENK